MAYLHHSKLIFSRWTRGISGNEPRSESVITRCEKFHFHRSRILFASRGRQALNVSVRKLNDPRRRVAHFDSQRFGSAMDAQCDLPFRARIRRFHRTAEFQRYSRDWKLSRVMPRNTHTQSDWSHRNAQPGQNYKRNRRRRHNQTWLIRQENVIRLRISAKCHAVNREAVVDGEGSRVGNYLHWRR